VWRDEAAWISGGISALFVPVAWLMHRIFVRILKNGATEPEQEKNHE
jgi:hypothetical protein